MDGLYKGGSKMISTRIRKLINDLSLNKVRTLLVILAMGIGIFGISVVANSYSILVREMDKNYMITNPASATLWMDGLTDSDIEEIRKLPYIEDAERRDKIVGRVQTGDNEWKDIWLYVIHDFNNLRLDTFTTEAGKPIPDSGEILFERKALNLANAKIEDSVIIRIPNGKATELKLTGTVHAPGLAPAWMEGFAYGLELKIQVSGDKMDKKHIRNTVYKLKKELDHKGIQVTRIEIPEPGKHPHVSQMITLLFLMEIFGVLALVLSGILLANMISSILEQQTRQIGIMKAIGASSVQIFAMYEGMVLIMAVVALALSIPLGILAGRSYAWIAAQILNFTIYRNFIPTSIYILEIVLGVFVPLFSAAYPILKGSRYTVHEAINDYGINQNKYSRNPPFAFPKFHTIFPRPFVLSFRNTFRRKTRFLFTTLVMAAGGTGFLVALNIYSSMYDTVDKRIDSLAYDIQLTFDHPQEIGKVNEVINKTEGIVRAEAWSGTSTACIYSDGTQSNSFSIIVPPDDTSLMTSPPMYAGRWMEQQDENVIVINQRLLSNEPDVKIGDKIRLIINRTYQDFKIIGISKELVGMPFAYARTDSIYELNGGKDYTVNLVAAINKSDGYTQSDVAKSLEENFSNQGMNIRSLIKKEDNRKAIQDHLLLIATFLIIMSLLVVLVGGLGLATTVSINVMERTREIGIMQATGASTHTITGIIVAEGIIMGVISWFISMVLSGALSRFVTYRFGMLFFGSPLEYKLSVPGLIIWLVMIVFLAGLASLLPSRKAINMPVIEALSYE